MKLKAYIKEHGLKSMAKEIGISQPHLWQIAEGTTKPSLSTKGGRVLINKIIQATNGMVTLKDINEDAYNDILKILLR